MQSNMEIYFMKGLQMHSEYETKKLKRQKIRDLGTWIVIGFVVGMLIGVVLDNLSFWAGLGICLGILIGAVDHMRAGR